MQAFGNAKLAGHHGSSALAASYAVLGRSAIAPPAPSPEPIDVEPPKPEKDERKTRRRKPLVSATSPGIESGEIDRRDLLEGNGFQFHRRSGPSSAALQKQRDKRYRRAMRMLGELHETKDTPELHDAIATQIVESDDKHVLMEMAAVLYRQKHRPMRELRGSNHHCAKLSEDKVAAVRHLYQSGEYSQAVLGRMFKVSQSSVHLIVTGMAWKEALGPVYAPSVDDLVIRNMIRLAQGLPPIAHRCAPSPSIECVVVPEIKETMATCGFEQFWSNYPKKIAKLAALKAYEKARSVASHEQIIIGLQKYIDHLPDDMQFIAHAASWLNAGRWMDEYSEPTVNPSADEDWFSECQELHGGTCGGSLRHRNKMLIEHRKRDAS